MRHIIAVLLENESGALARVVGLFAQRGYNIDSLTVAATEDPTMSRLTLVTRGDDQVIEQITKQLHKLIEVVKLTDLSESAHIERELMMVKVKASGATRRGQTQRRHLPRPDYRCVTHHLHHSGGRHLGETGSLY